MEPVVRFAALRAVQPAPPGQPLTAPVYDPSAIAEGAFLPSVRAASRDAVTGQRLAQSYLANRGPNPHAALLDALDDDLRGMAPAKQLLETLRLRTDRDPADWDPSALRLRCADDLLAATLDPASAEGERSAALRRAKVMLALLRARTHPELAGEELNDWLRRLTVLVPAEARRTPPVPPRYVQPAAVDRPEPSLPGGLPALAAKARRAMREIAGATAADTPRSPSALARPRAVARSHADGQEAIIELSEVAGATISSPRDVIELLERTWETPIESHPPPTGVAPAAPVPRTGAFVRPPGVIDLLVVRQRPIGYEAGEIAHIENVMRGEVRERLHRRVDTTEATDVMTEERTATQEKETQTTARADLASEASNLARLDARVAGHVNTDGQYGPTRVVTDVSGELDYSRETAERNASSYAKELTERAASQLVERTERQRSVRTATQIDEMVKHVVDAKEAESHAVGVYRWVNRVYECSLWRYEGRLLCEFQVPEPASWYRWWRDLERTSPGAGTPPPTLEELHLAIPEGIGSWALPVLQAKLGVTGLVDAPPILRRVPFSLSKAPNSPWSADYDDSVGHMEFVSSDVQIPEGYAAVSVTWQARTVGRLRHVTLKLGAETVISVCDETGPDTNEPATWVSDSAGADIPLPDQPVGALKAAVYHRAAGFEIIGEIACIAEPGLLATWQLGIHEKAVSAIAALRAAYESRTRASSAFRPQLAARPAAELRDIERNELRRAVLELLEGPGTIGQEGWVRDEVDGPLLQPDSAGYGRKVQFLEQAFEWGNLDQVYYPYFWAARERWADLLAESDPDPQFASFLRSGSARVTVPVTPGFERLLQAYLAGFGVWGGGDAPAVDDPLYRGIASEILERIEGPAGGTQVGDSWRITLPTTLVHLQADAELPAPPAP